MKLEKVAAALTIVNLALLLVTLPRTASTAAVNPAPVLRGQVLELTDDRGQIRARLNVEPDGETVFRLLDRSGTIRVKLGAGENGSGLVLLDERTEPAIHMVARQAAGPAAAGTTGITLRRKDGRRRVIEP